MSSDMTNILLILLIGAGIAINESDAFMEAVMACKEEHKMTREQITSEDETEDMKCFSECLMKKMGTMDDEGNLNKEKIEEEGAKFAKTDEQKRTYKAAVEGCLKENEEANLTGKCEKGYTFFKCIRKMIPMNINSEHIGLLLLLGAGIMITICRALPNEVAAAAICGPELNLTNENDVGLMMLMAMGADDYEVIIDEDTKCLMDCVARKTGYLDADDNFKVAEIVQKEVNGTKKDNASASDDEQQTKDEKERLLKNMMLCEDFVEKWNRTDKCEKGYLFLKCNALGKDGFEYYMELHNNVSNGSLKPVENHHGLASDYGSYDELTTTLEEQFDKANNTQYIFVNITLEQGGYAESDERNFTSEGLIEPTTENMFELSATELPQQSSTTIP